MGKIEFATFGAGCFWCVEAVFSQLSGVLSVKPGYAGGETINPTYEEVCSGNTGHAEVCLIEFDPEIISYTELLEVFWRTHDPTTPNRQGQDIGTQYRSVIFYHNENQKETAEEYKKKLDDAGIFDAAVITEITAAKDFFPAEDYHKNYFENNPEQPYCQYTIIPKLNKFKYIFADKIKKT
jgi:peptide-methionine (S)-S-oxide reductase